MKHLAHGSWPRASPRKGARSQARSHQRLFALLSSSSEFLEADADVDGPIESRCVSVRQRGAQSCFFVLFSRRATHQSLRNRSTHAGSIARRTKHQTGRPTRAGPWTPPNVPRTSPGALPHGGSAEGGGLPQARVNHASSAARQSDADGRPNAGKEAQVVSKALSPGSPATQCVEHGSRVRMLAPVTRPSEGPVHNMRVHQFRPKRRVLGLFPFPHGLRAILAGRNRVWGGDANVERSALVHRKRCCKDISRAGARGTSDEAKDLWLGCSISQPRVTKEHVTHLVVAPPRVRMQGKSAGHCEDPPQQVAGALPFRLHCIRLVPKVFFFREQRTIPSEFSPPGALD